MVFPLKMLKVESPMLDFVDKPDHVALFFR